MNVGFVIGLFVGFFIGVCAMGILVYTFTEDQEDNECGA